MCTVIHPYTAGNTDELSLAVHDRVEVLDDPDGGWWHGKLVVKSSTGESNGGEATGWFPSNHVEAAGGGISSPTLSARASNAAILERARTHGWATYTALHDFEPRNEDECELVADEKVSVVQKPDGGWWEVIVDGVHGWVPRSHLSETPVKEGGSSGDVERGAGRGGGGGATVVAEDKYIAMTRMTLLKLCKARGLFSQLSPVKKKDETEMRELLKKVDAENGEDYVMPKAGCTKSSSGAGGGGNAGEPDVDPTAAAIYGSEEC
jgi:hypothetical protein